MTNNRVIAARVEATLVAQKGGADWDLSVTWLGYL
jgi:hypothetical protein